MKRIVRNTSILLISGTSAVEAASGEPFISEFAAEKAGQIWSFGPVAFSACKAEDVRIVGPAVLLPDDVIDMERQEIRVIFVQATVFTATACPLPDESPESGVHYSPFELARIDYSLVGGIDGCIRSTFCGII